MSSKASFPIVASAKTESTCSCCAPGAGIQKAVQVVPDADKSIWRKSRGAVMFVLACLTSPCCTPLLVPLVIALLAGTPVALWMSAHLGWVFGGLTLISAISFVLAWRWLGSKTRPLPAASISNVTFNLKYPQSTGGISMSDQVNTAIACNLNAIKPDDRDQHTLTAHQLFASVTDVQELTDGFAFHLPADNMTFRSAADFIANERLCCPFFDFTLRVGAQNGLWLSLTGNDEVKQFVRAEFGTLLNETLSKAFVAS